MKPKPQYCIARYDAKGNRWMVSGCGRHKGTWEYGHSKRTAQRHVRRLRKEQPQFVFKVEEI